MKIYNWDVILVKFAYEEDSSVYKIRPAIVVDSNTVLIFAAKVTSQTDKYRGSRDYLIRNWKEAGLSKPSVVRLDKIIKITSQGVIRRLGHLSEEDIRFIQNIIEEEY
mgnify:CR=1 FL=1